VEILKSRGLDSAGTGAGSEAKLGQAATPMGNQGDWPWALFGPPGVFIFHV